MNKVTKWATIAGTVLITGGLIVGAAVAAPALSSSGNAPAAAQTPGQSHLDKAVKEGKLTQAEADVLKQLGDLRKSYMEKYKADAKNLIDQAVKSGKITQEQADKMLKGHAKHGWRGHKGLGSGKAHQQDSQNQNSTN